MGSRACGRTDFSHGSSRGPRSAPSTRIGLCRSRLRSASASAGIADVAGLAAPGARLAMTESRRYERLGACPAASWRSDLARSAMRVSRR